MSATEIDAVTDSAVALRLYQTLPGPRGVPVFGNALQADMTRFHQQCEGWLRTYGPLVRLKLGARNLLLVGDHELGAALFRDRPETFRRSTRFESIYREMGLPVGVFVAEGDDWRRQRRMVMASFDPAHIRNYFPAMQRVSGRLADRWDLAARSQASIDLTADLMRFTVDTVAGLAFGAEVNTLQSDDDLIQRHLDKIFPALARRTLAPFPTWRFLRMPSDRRLEAAILAVNRAIGEFIAQARARMRADPSRHARPHNLLEAMLSAADQPGSGIGDEQVAGNVLIMLLAGEDTTANSIAWMIELLWRHPTALGRATGEVRGVIPQGTSATMEQLAQLDYLEACIHETMRLKPVAPQVAMQAMHDVVVGDVMVPKDTVLIYIQRGDSLDDKHLPRATSFEPERWLAGAGTDAMAKSARRLSMPFGAGPRMCPGRYLAMLEMKMVMALLLERFDIEAIETPDGLPAQERLAVTMAPVGMRMRLRRAEGRGI